MNRTLRAVPAALFLLLALAGCLSGSDGTKGAALTGTDEPASTVVVQPEPGILIAQNRGAIKGTVRNEANLSVPDARVSLVDTDLFADTGDQGEFLFLNLTAQDYQVFVQASGYTSKTVTATVGRGNVTNVTVFLEPPLDSGGDERYHLHDFWGDRSEVLLMDDEVDLTTPRANGGGVAYSGPAAMTVNANGNSSERYKFWITGNGQDPAIVFPGTKELLIKLSWTQQDSTFDRLGIAYNHTGGAGIGTPIYLPLKTTGQSWSIPVPAGAADDGHRAFSKWKFWVHAGPSLTSNPQSRAPGALLAPIRVEVKIVKGDVVSEPPHPDFWQGRTQVEVLPRTACQITGAASYTSGNRASGSYHCYFPNALVPPATTRLRIDFYWEYIANAALANGSAADKDWVITWLNSNQHPAFTPLDKYSRAAPAFENAAGHHRMYDVPVKPVETDRYYDSRTGWVFLPSIKGEENDAEFEDTRGRNYFFQITAIRDEAG